MTATFWLIVSAMTLCVLGLLLRPLLKRPSVATSEQEKTLPVYRQQFSELEQDRADGLLTDEQYRTARSELERRVLEEAGSAEAPTAATGGLVNLRVVALSLAMIIPAASGVLYWTLGNPAAMTHPAVSASSSQGGPGDDSQMADSLNTLIEQLRKKLEQSPNDAVGWGLLARSYMAMERYADAVTIFETATKLDPKNASLLADYADALGVHQGRKLDGKPETLIQKALTLDPHNVKALMLSGTIAYNRKDFARAAKEWEDAHAYLPPDDQESADQLKASIAEAKRHLGGPSKNMLVANPPMEAAKPAKPATQSGQSRAITGKVVLGPNLTSKAPLPETLFVFAKDVAGPPMPVSIVRASKKDLPFTFRLDDSTSPMPSRKLSDIDTVVIVARLSKSGKAMPESGDLEGMSQPVKPGTDNITVVIDRERP